MKKIILLFLVVTLLSAVFAGTDSTVTVRKLGVAEFISDPNTPNPVSQQELVSLTEYLIHILKQRSNITIVGRDVVERLPNDQTIPLKQRYQEVGKYAKVDAVLGVSVSRQKDNSLLLNIMVISTQDNDYEELTGQYKETGTDGKSLKEQFEPIKEDVVLAFNNVVEGRSLFAPPDFRKIKVGLSVSDFIGFNNIFYLKNEDAKNPGAFFKANYQLFSGDIHITLSPNVFLTLGGLAMDATDKYQTDAVYTLRDIKSSTQFPSFWLPGGRNVFDILDSASMNDSKSVSLLRNGTRAFYLGGGLGIRFWKLRFGAVYYGSLHNLLPDIFTKQKSLNPPFIISGTADLYIIRTLYIGVSYYYANAGVVDNKIERIYPEGVPATFNNVEELGIRRRQFLDVTNVILRAGIEL